MDKAKLKKEADVYFAADESLNAIYATEKGHFFREKSNRKQYLYRAGVKDKPVDFFRKDFEAKKPVEHMEPKKSEVKIEDSPGYEVLKKHGYETVEKMKACEDLSKVQGIGPNKVEAIKEFLKNFD